MKRALLMGMSTSISRALVTGATGFVGRALVPQLVAHGVSVRATTRAPETAPPRDGVEWTKCDVDVVADVERALDGVDAAFFLVHGMGSGNADYAEKERRAARRFADIAAHSGVKRIVYLGGVAPAGARSEHLQSRLEVGKILRAGAVPTLELRASMIVGSGGASWQIVRDLAMRLPAMLLPAWTKARTCPVAIDDVVVALVKGLDLPLPESAWYDIPGPETLTGREMLRSVAALRGRRIPGIEVPFLSVSLSSWWLKLVTRTDFTLARELVLGFTGDLLPTSDEYWGLIGYTPKWSFVEAARKALVDEPREGDVWGVSGRLEESLVQLVGPKLETPATSPAVPSPRK